MYLSLIIAIDYSGVPDVPRRAERAGGGLQRAEAVPRAVLRRVRPLTAQTAATDGATHRRRLLRRRQIQTILHEKPNSSPTTSSSKSSS